VGLDAPLTVLRGIGPRQAENLQRLGLRTMGDALYFFPRRYVDYSELRTINRLQYGEEITLIATIWETTVRRIRGGQAQMVQSILSDGTGTIQVTWFNQPWLKSKLIAGRQVQVAGRVDQYLGRLTMQNPASEEIDKESLETGRIVPVYSLTQGISPIAMRRWMYELVGYTAPKVVDSLPTSIRTRARLLPLGEALLQIHFPDSQEMLGAARKRLAFDEMLLLQLGVQRQRLEWNLETARPLIAPDPALDERIAGLPYELTSAQKRAVADIRADMSRPVPMNRLLQGDVGSGKTVVAALAMAVAVGAGMQTALMAPTAILAEQHYHNLTRLLAGDPPPAADGPRFHPGGLALLLGTTPESEKREIYDGLRDGSIKIVIGTQALIQEKVEFASLGLVVMDEQHRFGVAQRARLRGKGSAGVPHVLVMTATPIPRTLALTVYGELDLSIIDEMPPGRLPVETRIVYVNERERAYAFLRQQVQQGRQAYVICPLVEESEKIEARAAVDEYERLKTHVFRDLRLGLLHGRMKADEKEEVMAHFRDGQVQVLVSTSVVEVGVDIPNASTVLVEGANRFGLSQLHQFRGRVGRGMHKSYCLLASDLGAESADESNTRLKDMENTGDGFKLAEKDLERRGPGEFLGTRQSGFGELKLARLTDLALIDMARREAVGLLENDLRLEKPEHAALAERLNEFWRKIEGAGDVS
jgi:ATP-dependent DNA helicase RecG